MTIFKYARSSEEPAPLRSTPGDQVCEGLLKVIHFITTDSQWLKEKLCDFFLKTFTVPPPCTENCPGHLVQSAVRGDRWSALKFHRPAQNILLQRSEELENLGVKKQIPVTFKFKCLRYDPIKSLSRKIQSESDYVDFCLMPSGWIHLCICGSSVSWNEEKSWSNQIQVIRVKSWCFITEPCPQVCVSSQSPTHKSFCHCGALPPCVCHHLAPPTCVRLCVIMEPRPLPETAVRCPRYQCSSKVEALFLIEQVLSYFSVLFSSGFVFIVLLTS